MPNRMATAVLNDIATEELAHLEMVSTIVHQLTRNLSMEEIKNSGFGPYYIDHTIGIWPQAAGGIPFNACEFQSKGDPILQKYFYNDYKVLLMNDELILKNNLKQVRTEKKLSQSALAEMVGVSRNTISSIETGQFNPTAKLALILCIALDKKFEELFYF